MNRKFQSNGEDKKGGLYHLLLRLPRKIQIRVGALDRKIFPSGYYIYTGSARRGLSHRLGRHLRRRKKRHWHIDFLTTVAPLKQILIDVSDRFTECQAHQTIMNAPGAEVIVAGFGSSDCRCRSHLAYFKKRPPLREAALISSPGHAKKIRPLLLISIFGTEILRGGSAMTKGDLIESIRNSSNGLSKKAAEEVVGAVFSTLSKTLKKEGRFAYPGFGVFTVKKRKARKGRNPKTGEAITIKASKTVGFKPAPSLKKSL
ncbi:DUF123 domain-containing protein [Candidatus Manganitrophus noduliformans]|uniref:DUF123 domain-containing protein n=1 Tax=Candidatus Manganitrophus noduliformans TaxID=2606439 RepID=A0A7X6DT19_9BACT|nr:DUF123 domain-containing protein [Candidatus Manganitrophus noduliformans]NKE72810.1 DUF123 domain-containing protein [Candidatus Manganitrophus noduliformans]